MIPVWILDAIAALMVMVAAVSAGRLVAARPWRRDAVVADTDVAHLLMAIAMAGMAMPSLGTLPEVAWEVIFGLLTAWFGGRVLATARRHGIRALAGGHCATHLVHSASMLYMFLAATAARNSGMSGMPGGPGPATTALSHPPLAFLFAVALVGYAIWDLDRLSGRRYATGARVSLAGVGVVGLPALADTQSPAGALPAGATVPADGALSIGVVLSAGTVPDANGSELAAQEAAAPRGGGAADAGGRPERGSGAFLLSPAVTVGGRITMSIVMAFMLLIAL